MDGFILFQIVIIFALVVSVYTYLVASKNADRSGPYGVKQQLLAASGIVGAIIVLFGLFIIIALERFGILTP